MYKANTKRNAKINEHDKISCPKNKKREQSEKFIQYRKLINKQKKKSN